MPPSYQFGHNEPSPRPHKRFLPNGKASRKNILIPENGPGKRSGVALPPISLFNRRGAAADWMFQYPRNNSLAYDPAAYFRQDQVDNMGREEQKRKALTERARVERKRRVQQEVDQRYRDYNEAVLEKERVCLTHRAQIKESYERNAHKADWKDPSNFNLLQAPKERAPRGNPNRGKSSIVFG